MTGPRYAEYQISASEALRAGGQNDLSPAEKIAFFEEASDWAAKAFLEARDNMHMRYLALCQYECAMGQILLVKTNYQSDVVSGIKADDFVAINSFRSKRSA